MQHNDHDQLIDVAEAAAILTVKPATVRAKVQAGKLPVIHPAGTRLVRFRRSDIERLAGLRPTAEPTDAPKQPPETRP